MTRVLGRITALLRRLEEILLVGLLTAMMGAAVLQILVRNLSDGGLMWADPLIRVLVLWAGLLGAMAATRDKKHITIDILTRYLSPGLRSAAEVLTMTATGILCLVTAWHSVGLVRMEMDFATPAFGSVPVWACQTIIPAAFVVIALRCLATALSRLIRLARPVP